MPSYLKIWEKPVPGGSVALNTLGSTCILSISGNLDAANASAVETEMNTVLDRNPTALTFDLAGLRYITSMGYRLFLLAAKRQKAHGGTVGFVNLQPQIQEVFDIMGNIPDLRIFASIEELDQYLLGRQTAVEREQ